MTATLAQVEVTTEADTITVRPVYAGVDRPRVGATSVPNTASGRKLAERLQRAIEAGKAFPILGVRTDVNGQTYAHTEFNVIGRYLNADLTRLGF